MSQGGCLLPSGVASGGRRALQRLGASQGGGKSLESSWADWLVRNWGGGGMKLISSPPLLVCETLPGGWRGSLDIPHPILPRLPTDTTCHWTRGPVHLTLVLIKHLSMWVPVGEWG